MSRILTCPSCDCVGYADPFGGGEFEVRGVFRGKAVHRCRACGCGLFLGMFSGILLGRPRLIPPDLWDLMQSTWAKQIDRENTTGSYPPWEALSASQQEQLKLVIQSLREFSYGYQRAMGLSKADPDSARSRFYSHALYQYCANYFTVTGGNKLRVHLTELGSEDLLNPIEQVLNVELGTTTLGMLLDDYRDKMLVHQGFRMTPIDKIYSEYDLSDEENADKFASLVKMLFQAIQELKIALMNRYPEAH